MTENSNIQNLKGFLGYILRKLLATLPVSLFHDRYFEKGVSFTILTKNDPWFMESIFSIYKYANEIILIDSSDDPVYVEYNKQIIANLRDRVKIKHIQENMNITHARRRAIGEASMETIVHWDADMIAFDSGKNSFKHILEFVQNRTGKKVVYFQLLTVCKDLSSIALKPVDIEPWIFSNTLKELYKPRPGNLVAEKMVEGFTSPRYFKRIDLDFYGAIHMKWVMPPEKALYKEYQGYLLNDEFMEKYGDYDSLKNEFKSYVANENPVCIPYVENLHGTYPTLLQRFIGLSYSEIITRKLEEIRNNFLLNIDAN